ncbi:FAD-dependent oxidoreductase [Laspinema olomoucense]|uniref:FAD-dependent oxidoreductase n=1 Tax=Laspinema olomoucense TaxID=3231600 RepID=UPI0021BB2011|nr:NAD(P)/FAD-dependent oxidoreductase [Laspinema sp. D3d]MCT7971784.1 FAD-dependent monooxygenase [Laspinema sp. D3d]
MALVQKAIIIGAGAAGLLLAHYLLRRGDQYCLELYERRPDPRQGEMSQARTFPISLQERGRKAIREIPGLEEAIAAQSVFCQGTMIYRPKSKPRRIPRQNQILCTDRNELVSIILQELTNRYSSDRLKIQFDCTCTQVDARAKTVTLESNTKEQFTTSYDVLVGADGAKSVVREFLVQNTSLECEQHYVPDAYKSLGVSRINSEKGLSAEPDLIHAWTLDNNTRLLLVPQPGDRLQGTLIFNAENNPLEGFSTPEQVWELFQEKFPLCGELMTMADADTLWKRQVARILTVRCDRFHEGDSILLMGDAAHAVSPSIGQGCNSALEDVLILDKLLDRYRDDWRQVLPQFSEQRVPDAHAVQDLSDYSFPRNKRLIFEFFLRLQVGRLLHRWFPQRMKPFVFDLVLDSDVSYSEVLRLNQGWINKVKRSVS